MADFIIHHDGAYNVFGTIADGVHYVSALTLDQLKDLLREHYGTRGMEHFDLRLERAHKTGCSGHDWTLDDCIAANRWDGQGESTPGCLPRDEFIQRYLTLESSSSNAGVQPAQGPSQPMRQCTWCGGAGRVGIPGKRCEVCDGKGKVPVPPAHGVQQPDGAKHG